MYYLTPHRCSVASTVEPVEPENGASGARDDWTAAPSGTDPQRHLLSGGV